MARALPYRAKCPPNIAALIEEAPYSRLFVLSDPGPTSFVLRGEASPRRFKVTIGETHSCSCRSGNELCIHILFVLMRVFRMPAANPLIWQLSLTEREIAELMRGRRLPTVKPYFLPQVLGRQLQDVSHAMYWTMWAITYFIETL